MILRLCQRATAGNTASAFGLTAALGRLALVLYLVNSVVIRRSLACLGYWEAARPHQPKDLSKQRLRHPDKRRKKDNEAKDDVAYKPSHSAEYRLPLSVHFSHLPPIFRVCANERYGKVKVSHKSRHSQNHISMPAYAENRKARFDYEILETYEAGIELLGFEVKAIRSGRIMLTGAFAIPRGPELWLTNASIPAYQPENTPRGYDPERARRLLLHKSEIATLIGKSRTAGLTIVPLRVYSKNRRIKVLLGVARRKKQFDKREKIKKRDMAREAARTLGK
ncbi:MAG: SsrA-binding protein [Parcubacteria group bacterium GW2011_GWA1_51_12]|nr:MAG: SsrA-binding protein [Parcubacteria group bacterium GW2011_GWA1_51_12]